MTINPLSLELGAEHRRDLVQRAADHRRPGTARRRRRLPLRVRQIRPDDGRLVAEIFAGLGLASRFSRYLTGKPRLSAAELRYFTEVDHRDHEALIAVTRNRGEAIGVARYVRDRQHPTHAEVAIEVVDDWQNRGVGSLLAARLSARAKHEGISHITALMTADNVRSRRLLERIGTLTGITRDGAAVTYDAVLT
ncbi:MAG: GNAT family N-acetyltransferase [Intrasporangium sp.]|uniref:GNAT family N-acetyltransferase n=1 Tax=Intrasporangium sp. TaxID=1925024 RepID=UPI00264814F1|nr:GNAT family N-acetyltransferase [Intrasporangium sp.]MDN5797061.1 GNAT family N-acetyltransferase [Intrasporangium sp.]